jgi:hypothetical protein
MEEQALILERKNWDSDFFKREIYQLIVNGPISQSALNERMKELDCAGVWGVETVVYSDRVADTPILEDAGFRLVDSKMTFISKLTESEVANRVPPFGSLRQVSSKDISSVSELTVECLVDNPEFNSRFKNPRLFSREESIRYYNAWNERCYTEQPELFVVWEVDGRVIAYFNYMRADTRDYSPLFKGILTAVNQSFRGYDLHNLMQEELFRRFGVQEWWVDNSTQVTNIAVIKNHIKARKVFKSSSLIFYRTTRSLFKGEN